MGNPRPQLEKAKQAWTKLQQFVISENMRTMFYLLWAFLHKFGAFGGFSGRFGAMPNDPGRVWTILEHPGRFLTFLGYFGIFTVSTKYGEKKGMTMFETILEQF
jgi:hypothetical protein